MSFSAGKNLQNNINTTEAQTLQNKTLDNTNTVSASIENPDRLDVKKDTLSNLETYALTATDGQLVFATDTQTMFQIKDNALAEVGSGSSEVNYISNPDFEQGDDGYVSDVNLTIAQTQVANEILRGSASGKLSKAAVDASDEEISIPFTVDRSDLAKKLTISFDYDASDVNYADNDILIGVRQDPNGTPSIIRINGEDLKGGKGTHYAQFQTDASIDEYELFFKVNSTNASAYDVIIDDVKVGPREVAFGSLVTDWIAYTPTFTGFGTVSGVDFEYKRVGDSMIIRGEFTSGTSTAVEAQITLPNNLQVRSDITNPSYGGTFVRNVVTANSLKENSVLFTGGDSFLNFSTMEYALGNEPLVPKNGSVVLGSSESAYIHTKQIPIQGWSSNAVTSEDLGGREVVVRGVGNSGAAITANTERIDFTVVEDTTASWSQVDGNGTDTFTAPETGYYAVSGSVRLSATDDNFILAFIDNVEFGPLGNSRGSSALKTFSGHVYLEKGQTLDLRLGINATLSNVTTDHRVHIQKLASPQSILETETVAARYTSNSGQSLGVADITVVYEDLDFDTHNSYNTSTGEYTVPVSGYYNVHSKIRTSVINTSSNFRQIQLDIKVNNITVSVGIDDNKTVAASSSRYNPKVSDILYLEKGDILKINTSNGLSSSTLLDTDSNYNTFSIARIK